MNTYFSSFLNATQQSCSHELRHRPISSTENQGDSFIWEEQDVAPFDEIIASWEASRPHQGHYLLRISLFTTAWSPWLDYAFWGTHNQYTFQSSTADVKVFQDTVEVQNGAKASAFRIQIQAHKGATLNSLRTLHASLINRSQHIVEASTPSASLHLDVQGLSQIALPDARHHRLCSPTSTTAAIRFLLQSDALSPLDFAKAVCDSAFDIYGNWILNSAQAAHELGEGWHCCVTRFNHFNQIIDSLRCGYPVVVSVKGPLPGSASPYGQGHLLVITGVDAQEKTVLCMDPGFPTDATTHVSYALDAFLAAWSRRQGLAYIFYQ